MLPFLADRPLTKFDSFFFFFQHHDKNSEEKKMLNKDDRVDAEPAHRQVSWADMVMNKHRK